MLLWSVFVVFSQPFERTDASQKVLAVTHLNDPWRKSAVCEHTYLFSDLLHAS